jgi:hypothetical protein
VFIVFSQKTIKTKHCQKTFEKSEQTQQHMLEKTVIYIYIYNWGPGAPPEPRGAPGPPGAHIYIYIYIYIEKIPY